MVGIFRQNHYNQPTGIRNGTLPENGPKMSGFFRWPDILLEITGFKKSLGVDWDANTHRDVAGIAGNSEKSRLSAWRNS